MREIVFLLEEESAKALIEVLLPTVDAQIQGRFIVFEGKQDLEKQLERNAERLFEPAGSVYCIEGSRPIRLPETQEAP